MSDGNTFPRYRENPEVTSRQVCNTEPDSGDSMAVSPQRQQRDCFPPDPSPKDKGQPWPHSPPAPHVRLWASSFTWGRGGGGLSKCKARIDASPQKTPSPQHVQFQGLRTPTPGTGTAPGTTPPAQSQGHGSSLQRGRLWRGRSG